MLLSTRVTSLTPGSLRVTVAPPALVGPVRMRHLPLPALAGGEDRPDTRLAHLLDRMVGQPVQIFLAGGLTLQGVLAAAAGDSLVLAGSGPVTYVNARDVAGIAAGSRAPAAAGKAVTTTMGTVPPPEPEERTAVEPIPGEAAPAAGDAEAGIGGKPGPDAPPPPEDAPIREAVAAGETRRPAMLLTQPVSFSQTWRRDVQTARAATRSPCPRALRWRCLTIAR